jgi:hypothetical protein
LRIIEQALGRIGVQLDLVGGARRRWARSRPSCASARSCSSAVAATLSVP